MNKETQGSQKIKNYFAALLKSDSFNKLVKDSRKKYDIPKKGFKIERPYSTLKCPKNFNHFDDLIKDIDNYCKSKEILNINFSMLVFDEIIYNENFILTIPHGDVCMISDLIGITNLYMIDPEAAIEAEKTRNTIYPVAIQISPYASLRDILDFVRKNSKAIQDAQKRHKTDKIKIGKYRIKKAANLARDKMIYENKHKTRKELYKLIDKAFGDSPDEGALGKIISIANKTRKEL